MTANRILLPNECPCSCCRNFFGCNCLSHPPDQRCDQQCAYCWNHQRENSPVMNFSEALHDIKNGFHAFRGGWNGPNQYVVLQNGYPDGIPINANTAQATGLPEGTVCIFRPYLMLCTADGSFVPWAPSVSDVLADDWHIDPAVTPGVDQDEEHMNNLGPPR